MQVLKVVAEVEQHPDYTTFSDAERQLFAAAHAACHRAYAPYSDFQVGAAVLLADGQIYEGNNQENAAYPSGLCAERVALFYVSATHPDIPIAAVAVTVNHDRAPDFDDLVSPCGGCRQVIAEYEHKFKQPIKIYLLGRDERVSVIPSMQVLLPFFFSSEVLGKFK